MDDVLEMTDTEMKEIGINAFSHRKRLLRVIEDEHAGQNTAHVQRVWSRVRW